MSYTFKGIYKCTSLLYRNLWCSCMCDNCKVLYWIIVECSWTEDNGANDCTATAKYDSWHSDCLFVAHGLTRVHLTINTAHICKWHLCTCSALCKNIRTCHANVKVYVIIKESYSFDICFSNGQMSVIDHDGYSSRIRLPRTIVRVNML